MNAKLKNDASHTIARSVLGVLLLFFIVLTIIMSLVPPVSRDALTHHLAVPKLYLQKGAIIELPWLKFSYYPMNLDLLYSVPLYFGNDILPKQIHLLFGLMTAVVVMVYLKRKLDMTMALAGGLMFLSLPIVIRLSTSAYVDLGLTFFSTVSLLLLMAWRENPSKLIHLLLSAVACGLAMGTKYNGMICLLLMACLVPYVYLSANEGTASHEKVPGSQIRAMYYAAMFVLIALIVFSPWMIRNYLWTENPLHPLWQSIFSAQSGQETSTGTVFVKRKLAYNESFIDILTIPLRIFFQGEDNRPEYFDGRLNPFLLVFPFFAFLRFGSDSIRPKADMSILLVYALLFLLIVFFRTDMRIRYVLPMVPPLVILSIFGINNILTLMKHRLVDGRGKLIFSILLMSLLSLIYINGSYAVTLFRSVDPLPYLCGTTSRDQYIQKRRPEYACMQYINQNLSQSDKILAVFLGHRGYYCDRPIVFGNLPFKHIVRSATSSEDAVNQLIASGFTHILIRYDLVAQWATFELDRVRQGMLAELFSRQLKLTYAKGGYGVYSIDG